VLFTCLGSPGKPMFDTAGPCCALAGDRVLLCSDGLWGSAAGRRHRQQLASAPVSDAVPELVGAALRHAGAKSDNVTVLAIEWEAGRPSVSTQAASRPQMMSDEVFASTIQAGVARTWPTDELDEAAIERSIAEINEAIQRVCKRPNEPCRAAGGRRLPAQERMACSQAFFMTTLTRSAAPRAPTRCAP
jgi:hypothetical protein